MKKILLAICCVGFGVISKAQCDKNLRIAASKTEYLDTSGNVIRTVEETSSIVIGKNTITITPGNNPVMSGSATELSCNWDVPYQAGKSVYEAIFSNGNDTKNIILTIEGKKDNRVSCTLAIKESPEKIIRIVSDKFEEWQ